MRRERTVAASETGSGDGHLARTFASLQVRNFRYYFAGQSLSLIGTWMQSVTQSWLVFTWTHSGFQVGLIVALQTLPILLLGPLGGTIADRFGKYRVLFYTQALAGVQALVAGRADPHGNAAAVGAVLDRPLPRIGQRGRQSDPPDVRGRDGRGQTSCGTR